MRLVLLALVVLVLEGVGAASGSTQGGHKSKGNDFEDKGNEEEFAENRHSVENEYSKTNEIEEADEEEVIVRHNTLSENVNEMSNKEEEEENSSMEDTVEGRTPEEAIDKTEKQTDEGKKEQSEDNNAETEVKQEYENEKKYIKSEKDQTEEEKNDADKTTDSDEGGKTVQDKNERRDRDGGDVEALVLVGTEEGWEEEAGRVEDSQLTLSAINFNYRIRRDSSVTCPTKEPLPTDYLILFFPRGEGVIQAEAQQLVKVLQMAAAAILVPDSPINAIVGWARTLRAAALDVGVTSLAALAERMRSDRQLRTKYRAKVDRNNLVFHVLNDLSFMDNDGMRLTVRDERYELKVDGHVPVSLLATPTSAHGRALLLALSDYLVGSHHPEFGCIKCTKNANVFELNVTHTVVVGVFISRPQPFLIDTLNALFRHGLHPRNTHFYVYNQVPAYEYLVKILTERLRTEGEVATVTLLQASGGELGIGAVKNMILQECLRLGCKWYINVDSYAFVNPQILALLLSLDFPVLAPGLKTQHWLPSTFQREIDSTNKQPTYSWDHANILSDQPNFRGHWHASCISGVYAVRHDIITRFPALYTQEDLNPDLAFCSALREAGVPMVVTTAFANLGALINVTNHDPNSPDLTAYESNPLLWETVYRHHDMEPIMTGDFTNIARPCHEVYQYATFTPRFAKELIQLSNLQGNWSKALTKDPRKEVGIEEIPTVDQWLSHLGLEDFMNTLFDKFLKLQLVLAFPESPRDVIIHSLVARFQRNEIPGLRQHHDASDITFLINLTPLDQYQGGEVEFPQQENCRLKPEVGHILAFPGRLTHPKIFHNITEGVLHRVIIHFDQLETMQHYN